MPVSELDIATALFWLFGIEPADPRGPDIANRLDLRRTRDAAHLREVLLASEFFHRQWVERPRQQANPPLDLDRPRLVFLHIPKCGGTTLHHILTRHVAPDLTCPERFNNLRGHRLDELCVFTLFSGHFDLESCQALAGRQTRIVTLLREPRERLVSLYHFLSIHRPDAEPATTGMVRLARALPIEDFFAHPLIRRHASIYNGMAAPFIEPQTAVRWEAIEAQHAVGSLVVTDPSRAGHRAGEVLGALTGFGLLERFPDSLALLSKDLGLRLEDIPARQVTDQLRLLPHMDAADRPALTPALIELLDGLTEADRVLYAQAQTLFAARRAAPQARTVEAEAGFGDARSIPLDLFSPREGRRDGPSIVASGIPGVLAAGPYMALRHGRYRLACHFASMPGEGMQPAFTVNIWSNRGLAPCAAATWTGPSPCVIDFALPYDVTDIEFVVNVGRDSRFELLAVDLARATS